MSTLATSIISLNDGRISVEPTAKKDVRRAVLAFLDMASTATGQKTFYNKKSEQQDAMKQIHDAVYTVNPGLYIAMLSLPGVLDVAVQDGVSRILKESRENSILTDTQESEIIKMLTVRLKADRMLKMFDKFRAGRVNNSRSRTLILSSVIASKNVVWWSIKYRRLMSSVLRHAWGTKYTPVVVRILTAITKGEDVAARDRSFITKHVDKYAEFSSVSNRDIYEAICFTFGASTDYKHRSIVSRINAREDLDAGKKLPSEVLEGLRGRFHKSIDKGRILEITKDTMTDKQKVKVQRAAKKAAVTIEFDPSKLDTTSLYVYALEEGITDKVREALDEKADAVASAFPLRYGKVAVVVDTSLSMSGTDTNKNRPLAISLAMRDVLSRTGDAADVIATNGTFNDNGLVKAVGETSLAKAVAKAFAGNPDVVYIVTDGYENAPAGRVNEVISAVRDLGIETPVYQFNPVMASEAAGVRSLSPLASTLPVSKPEGIGLSLIRAALEQDIDMGLQALVDASVPSLGEG